MFHRSFTIRKYFPTTTDDEWLDNETSLCIVIFLYYWVDSFWLASSEFPGFIFSRRPFCFLFFLSLSSHLINTPKKYPAESDSIAPPPCVLRNKAATTTTRGNAKGYLFSRLLRHSRRSSNCCLLFLGGQLFMPRLLFLSQIFSSCFHFCLLITTIKMVAPTLFLRWRNF